MKRESDKKASQVILTDGAGTRHEYRSRRAMRHATAGIAVTCLGHRYLGLGRGYLSKYVTEEVLTDG